LQMLRIGNLREAHCCCFAAVSRLPPISFSRSVARTGACCQHKNKATRTPRARPSAVLHLIVSIRAYPFGPHQLPALGLVAYTAPGLALTTRGAVGTPLFPGSPNRRCASVVVAAPATGHESPDGGIVPAHTSTHAHSRLTMITNVGYDVGVALAIAGYDVAMDTACVSTAAKPPCIEIERLPWPTVGRLCIPSPPSLPLYPHRGGDAPPVRADEVPESGDANVEARWRRACMCRVFWWLSSSNRRLSSTYGAPVCCGMSVHCVL
jgi:hypothetical protein